MYIHHDYNWLFGQHKCSVFRTCFLYIFLSVYCSELLVPSKSMIADLIRKFKLLSIICVKTTISVNHLNLITMVWTFP